MIKALISKGAALQLLVVHYVCILFKSINVNVIELVQKKSFQR